MNYKTRMQAKECEEELAERDRQKQLEFERTQLEMRLTYEKKIEETRQAKTTEPTTSQAAKTAKPPKLVITKFRGDLTDWPRFWSQFETEIDKAEKAGVTKYSYLKELVDPKIRTEIDGLPFSSEGYERAKNILTRKYGQTGEVVNAYVENIMSLPTIGGTQPARIHDFYEKLLFNVQSLETMGKLREVNGYVRMTIDKLPGIRGDLVRTDDSWREWNFPKLVDELRKWTERNPIQFKQSDKPWRARIFKPSRREMAKIGDAFFAENKITNPLTAKRLPLSTIAEKCLATNASVSIVPETNTELTIARAVPCARFVREDITRPSATALVTS